VEASLRVWAFDSWDNEPAAVKLGDVELWSDRHSMNQVYRTSDWRFSYDPPGAMPSAWGGGGYQAYADVTVFLNHTNASVTLSVGARLNEPAINEAFGFNHVVLKLYYVPTTPPPEDGETESEGFDFLNPWFLIPFLLCSCCCGYIAYLFYDGWRKNSEKRARGTKQASVVPNEVSVVPSAAAPTTSVSDPEAPAPAAAPA
jgi:hypothetical protein